MSNYLDSNGLLYLWGKIKALVTNSVSGKQDTLTTAQMNAVNSGITSTKVSKYDGYESTINGKATKETTLSGYGITDAYTKTETDDAIADAMDGITPSSTKPAMDGTASAGSSTDYARGDHVHPTDTSRASASALTSHTGNNDIHVTASEKQTWNKKANTATTLAGYGITNAYTKTETDKAIADALDGITGIDYQVVTTLPSTGVKGTIYLVSSGGTSPNVYDEYIWVNKAFEIIGTTAVDLSGYWAKADLVAITNAQIDTIVAS